MKRSTLILAALVGALAGTSALVAQTHPDAEDGPWWAYGFVAAPKPGEASPDCGVPTPITCARPRAAAVLEENPITLPEAPRPYTRRQVSEWFGPADWYPQDHPPMPSIVARGNEQAGIRACALCHLPNGKGRSENAQIAGLPVAYFMQQLEAFKKGERRNADPRKFNTKEMIAMARTLTAEEMQAAAEYYSSIKYTPWVRVVETDMVPAFRQSLAGMFLPDKGDPVPLGNRIIEMPERPEETEFLRNPRSGWVAYVPKGSVARGEALARSCTVCHGANLSGAGNVPGIAGKTASYMVRQLYDMQQGTRKSLLMAGVVAKMTPDDMLNLGAYLASRQPE